ncbi:MAG: amidohydrolase family protein, partial [Verrucomicrobiae bacterium]|nr:amidohydrolase family protein [Verrucomicrobiae bacterium]
MNRGPKRFVFQPVSILTFIALALLFWGCGKQADTIVFNGAVVTVDSGDRIVEAMAIQGDRILKVGSDEEIMALKGPETEIIDLKGKAVLPGLIDSHTHPTGASMFEFDHEVPEMLTIQDVLSYIRGRAAVVPEGEWIVLQQVFITRLKEQRYPTRSELDQVAPNHPVIFRTGPDASMNSLALAHFNIDANYNEPSGTKIEREEATNKPTGIVRGWSAIIKLPPTGKTPTHQDRYDRLLMLFKDYNSVGITSIADRNCPNESMDLYQEMFDNQELPLRLSMSRQVGYVQSAESIKSQVEEISREPLFTNGTPMLKTVGIKMFMDGGMLTGSAYMREPWGVSEIYGIDDPEYRGLRFIPEEKLITAVRTCVENGLQFTAHCVGDGAVYTLIDAYEEVGQNLDIKPTRPNIT